MVAIVQPPIDRHAGTPGFGIVTVVSLQVTEHYGAGWFWLFSAREARDLCVCVLCRELRQG